MERPIAQRLKTRIEDLKAIRDEIRLDLHLATMDLRDEWKQLEGNLPDPAAAAQLKEVTSEALDRLGAELKRFRARLRNSAGVRTVAQLMRPAVTCRTDDSLATAVTLMWDRDVGFLPVTDDQDRLVGVVTDRDACVAACTRGARMHELQVHTVMTSTAAACRPTDAIGEALALMRSRQLRRVPVTDDAGTVVGVVTINDFARAILGGGVSGLDAATVAQTLVAITRPSEDAN